MLKKIILFVPVFIILFTSQIRADEGMWIPLFLNKYNIEEMQKKGFKLTAEDIYSVNKASMKDAVMIFGRGCTAELISDQGLIITNHHCGFSRIQSHSSLEHDYLTHGFWAMSKKEELVNEGLTVTFLVRMEDVTEKILKGINDDMLDEEKDKKIEENMKITEEEAGKDNNYKVGVKSFFYGNQYFLFVEKIYKDVRLVGAPPSSIGKFGGDTDNWMWPRHTGDFSLFRIYADENNEPAEYSENNVPYKPVKHFPVSLKGVKKGDFTLVFGYPGRTQEYLTSYAVDMIKNKINPHRIKIRQNIIDIMSADMEKDPGVRIKYAAKYARVSNYWKKWLGENRGLDILNAVEKKQQTEKQLTKWISESKDRTAKYGHLLPKFKSLYEEYTPYFLAEEYFYEAIWRMESVKFSSKMASLLKKGDKFTTEDIESTKRYAEKFFKDYNLETDKKMFKKLLILYFQNAGENFQPEILDFIKPMSHFGINAEYAIEYFTDFYFDKTFYLYEDKFNEFIEKYSYGSENESKIKDTPAYNFFFDFMDVFYTKIILSEKYTSQIKKLNHTYMRALTEADTNKIFYPDANSTLRISYGQVDTYEPKDGVKYRYYTTLEGVIEKDNPDIYDYDVPDKLKKLYNEKDYGRYAEEGNMHVCFIASNHTSGGNSGSPVVNGNGELIGVNFDRNWEGTMSDIMYNPDQCRNISLDIRYVLFIIDKFAGASWLVDEMTIVE
ncbi:MAG: S46 family peptidase [Bacteroidales bacterium]|nr:S46 family peptidase [Bacteroidales bacterium]